MTVAPEEVKSSECEGLYDFADDHYLIDGRADLRMGRWKEANT